MKTSIVLLLTVSSFFCATAQNLGMNYQAVIRDNNGALIQNAGVLMRLAFLQGGTTLYTEEHAITSDEFGQISFVIGEGIVLNGDYQSIHWSNKDIILSKEVFFNGQWIDLGTSNFESVPYAYHASSADSTFRAQTADSALVAYSYGGETLEIGANNPYNPFTKITISNKNDIDNNLDWIGMFVEAKGKSVKPFYGFQSGGTQEAFIYLDPVSSELRFFNQTEDVVAMTSSGLRLTNESEGFLITDQNGTVSSTEVLTETGSGIAVNGTSQVGAASFTVHSNATNGSYGGMYANTGSNGRPFYGYSQNGSAEAWHQFYNDAWRLNMPSERLTITTDGRVGINNSNPITRLHVIQRAYNTINNATDNGPIYRHAGLRLQHSNGKWIGVSCSTGGNILFNTGDFTTASVASIDNTTGVYNQISDSTLKENIKPLENISAKLMQLNPKEYDFKGGKDSHQFGFLAQDIQKVFPHMVKDNSGTLTVSYSDFSAVAIKALQEQAVLINSLKEQVDNDKAKIQYLSDQVESLKAK